MHWLMNRIRLFPLCALIIISGQIARAESTFVELHLSSDGVYAVDSSGKEWEYDFSGERFVRDSATPGSTQTVFGREIQERADEIDTGIQRDVARARAELDRARAEAESAKTEYGTTKRIKGLQLGKVEIGPDERIEGTVVAVGPVTVKGMVDGDVISYKRITITSTGLITGDARAPEIVKMRGGIIQGRRYETDLPQIPDIRLFEETSYTGLIVSLIIFVVLLFSGFLGVAIAPRPVDRLHLCLDLHFLKSFLIGFIAWLLLGPAFALLCLTIIGIPVAIFILPLALVLAVVMGSLALAQLVGERVDNFLGGRYKSQLLHLVAGLIILYFAWILTSLFKIAPTSMSATLGTLFMVLAIIIWSIGVTAGIGAVILTRYGIRDCEKAISMMVTVQTSPPAPPPPTPPPLKSE